MATDVHKPSSSDYPPKPTSTAYVPSSRDHQHNYNQPIPTITTKDQAIDVPPNFFDTYDTAMTTATATAQNPRDNHNQTDFSNMTLEQQM